MKKDCRSLALTSKHLAFAALLSTAVLPAVPCQLNPFAASQAFASSEVDRKYALETVGFLRTWDNMDGLFADYVSAAYREYFTKQSRFVLQDLSKADAVLANAKIPYVKLIEDTDILGQLSRSTKSQTIIRTKVQKEGPQYRFTLSWLHAPAMDLLANEEFVLREKEGGSGFSLDELKTHLHEALNRMIKKVPFLGSITGRDNNSVTVNLGHNAGLKPGDTLNVATLDEVKKHPLLKEIVDWRLTSVGKIEIDQIEDSIAFGRVVEEEAGRQIGRYQKIVQIIPKPAAPEKSRAEGLPETLDDTHGPEMMPTLGWVSASLMGGGFTRQFSATAGNIGKTGAGLAMGVQADGHLWFTREWFADFAFGYGFWRYAQQDITTAIETSGNISGGLTYFKLGGGYSYLLTNDLFGPKGWVKAGIHSISYSLPINGTESIYPSSFRSPYIGVGGELPIRDKYGVRMDLEFGLFTSGTETGNAAAINGASDIVAYLGGYYRYNTRMTIRAGIQVIANGTEATPATSMSQKVITFMPSILYYF